MESWNYSKEYWDNLFPKEVKLAEDLTDIWVDFYNKTFPPYQIIKTDKDQYFIELSVPGFDKSTLNITIDGDMLRIVGEAAPDLYKDYHGNPFGDKSLGLLMPKNFEKEFLIKEGFIVKTSQMFNGLLRIWLEAVTPKGSKPQKVEIQ